METLLMLADKKNSITRKRMIKLSSKGSLVVRIKDNWLGDIFSTPLDIERLNKCYLP